jgi:hypothetical protein
MPLQIARTDRQLSEGIRDNDHSAMKGLVSPYSERIRLFLRRTRIVAAEVAALGGDILQTVVDSVRGSVRQGPAALPAADALRKPNAEAAKIARAVLAAMPEHDREALMRYYLGEQPADQICESLRITPKQLHLVKSQAKARFCELGRKRAKRAPVDSRARQKYVA